MFESFRLVVDLVPGHAEHFRQHAFDQVVTNHCAFGDLPPLRGQADVPFFFMETSPSFFNRFRSNVTAGLVTESQWQASRVSPSAPLLPLPQWLLDSLLLRL